MRYGLTKTVEQFSELILGFSVLTGPAGEADEAWFQSAFEDVTAVICLNHREYETLTKKIVEDLRSAAEFWEKKVDAVSDLNLKLSLPI